MPVVNISMFEGRTVEQKRQLVAKMTDVLIETTNCKRDSVKIFITDVPDYNIGEGGTLRIDKPEEVRTAHLRT